MSDSDDSSSPGGSDSAVESSSDDENDKGDTSDDSDSDSSSGGKSSSLDSDKEDFNPFGSSGESCGVVMYSIPRYVSCRCCYTILLLLTGMLHSCMVGADIISNMIFFFPPKISKISYFCPKPLFRFFNVPIALPFSCGAMVAAKEEE